MPRKYRKRQVLTLQEGREKNDFYLTRRLNGFRRKYGQIRVRGTSRKGFDLLAWMFNTGVSHVDIARIFDVTTQRVSQWWYDLYCPARDRGLLPVEGLSELQP